MVGKTLVGQDDQGKEEEKKPLLEKTESLRIEPRNIKSVLEDIPPVIEPKKSMKVSPKETGGKREERTIVHPMPTKIKTEISSQAEGKSSPFFKFLFAFSFVFMALSLGLLLLPLLNISIPPFLTSIINFVAPK